MTVVAGLITKPGWCYMAADSAVSNDSLYTLMAEPKVMNFYDEALVGYAGDVRQGRQVFRFLMDVAGSKVAAFERKWTKDLYGDVTLLFIEQGRIYEFDEGAVIPVASLNDGATYSAIGTGAPTALGSLYADHADLQSVTTAIQASIAHVPGIYGPPLVVNCPPFD